MSWCVRGFDRGVSRPFFVFEDKFAWCLMEQGGNVFFVIVAEDQDGVAAVLPGICDGFRGMILNGIPAEVEFCGVGGVPKKIELASLEIFLLAELFEEVSGEFVVEGVSQE